MVYVLADTSAWVEYDRATESAADFRMDELVGGAGDDILVSTEPVLMEVLAGARTKRRSNELRRLIISCHWVASDAGTDYEAAAGIYRQCRAVGITPRGLLDCLIVAIAWRADASVLAHDSDFARVAEVISVPLDPASHEPSS